MCFSLCWYLVNIGHTAMSYIQREHTLTDQRADWQGSITENQASEPCIVMSRVLYRLIAPNAEAFSSRGCVAYVISRPLCSYASGTGRHDLASTMYSRYSRRTALRRGPPQHHERSRHCFLFANVDAIRSRMFATRGGGERQKRKDLPVVYCYGRVILASKRSFFKDRLRGGCRRLHI